MAFASDAEVYIVAALGVVLIFAFALGFGIIPYKVKAFHSSQLLIDLTTSFAAGLYLGFSLAYLLPEAISILLDTYGEHDYPWDYFIVIFAFVMLLFVEKVLLNNPFSFLYKNDLDFLESTSSGNEDDKNSGKSDPKSDEEEAKKHEKENNEPEPNEPQKEEGEGESAPQKPEGPASKEKSEKSEVTLFKMKISSRKNYANILLFGICFKGMLVGIALGVQSKLIRVIHLTLAVLLYKWAEALAISVTLKKTNVEWERAIWMILLNASMPAIGFIFGIMITGFKESLIGIFYALLAGVLFYVASIDILQESFEVKNHIIWKFLSVCLGIFFIILMDLIHLRD